MRKYKKRYPDSYYSKGYKIYYLSIDGIAFYIGLTKTNLIKRLSDSKKDAKQSQSVKNRFISKEVFENKRNLEIHLIELVDETEGLFYEEYWIHQFKTWGFNILNQYKSYPIKRIQKRECQRYTKVGQKPFNINYQNKSYTKKCWNKK